MSTDQTAGPVKPTPALNHEAPALPKENVYGSLKRLEWIRSKLSAGDRIVDVGCGTGYMVTYPLLAEARDVIGVDLDSASIEYGRRVLEAAGLDASRLCEERLEEIEGEFDVAIVSEVLEHQDEESLSALLEEIALKLRAGGALLVTVPNGYGPFELESAIFYRLGVGRLLERVGALKLVGLVRYHLSGGYRDAEHPSSLEGSPHLQRFTRASIRRRLEASGFRVLSVGGNTVFAGPFSAALFTGWSRFMRLNAALADRYPQISSDFLVHAVRR